MATLIQSVNKPDQYREFYPPIEPFHTFMLSVDDIHTIYVEQSGNKNGKPVVVLHGVCHITIQHCVNVASFILTGTINRLIYML